MSDRGGFTLVETLVVLAVTTVLFVAIVTTLTARQGRVQFSQGMREIEADLRDVFNDLSDGFYPTTPGLICQAGSDNSAPQLDYNTATPTDTTGAKDQCVFAGKLIQFGLEGDDEADRVTTYIMAGRRVHYTGTEPGPITGFDEFRPIVISSLNTDNVSSVNPNITQIDIGTTEKKLPYGIHMVRSDRSRGGRAIGIIYNSFRGTTPGGGEASGTTGIGIANVYSVALGAMTPQNVISAADDIEAADFITGTNTITLCFESGTTDQTATITIGKGIQGALRLDYDVNLGSVACV